MFKEIGRLLFLGVIAAGSLQGDFIDWYSNNAQVLRGWDYELGNRERTIVTLEHANSWLWGDFFTFVDITHSDGRDISAYGEASPRLSLCKVLGREFSKSFVRDFLISTTFEKGKGPTRAILYGGAIDLNLPGFKFFRVNVYERDMNRRKENTWQVTLSWNRPIEISSMKFLFEGFADFAGNAGSSYRANESVVPRFLLDLGDLLGKQSNKLWLGCEYSYWHNKFGVRGKTESHPQLQIKWVF